MDVAESSSLDAPQAMDTSEVGAKTSTTGSTIRKVKGRKMKRMKNVRKMKAKAHAISKNEMTAEKVSKSESKKMRTLSAKSLYE
ncbi:hypothetical protein MLD38_000657 [Melastoma candidum]|uniref:Uncharacterized protein n=1 Tax=Melastoma candidum TaxID=119954 RepID=A0ACB9SAK6_9MYRT|nr:hypothetical protein MLD38_000657 [Melastoma candidum]